MDVLIDAYDRTGDDSYLSYFDQWYDGIKIGNQGSYFNPYNDDMAWIGITMTKIYQRTRSKKFLDTSLYLWKHIICNWNTQYAGGGVAWKVDSPWSKNACINGPSAVLAMQLYSITQDKEYLEWADKIYLWTRAHLFNRSTGAVYDHINGRTLQLGKRTFTYNPLAKGMDILKDEGAGDAALFKGIFMRYLVDLIKEENLDSTHRDQFQAFMIHNAEIAWTGVSKSAPYFFSPDWQKPAGDATTCNAQVSGSTLLESVCRVLY